MVADANDRRTLVGRVRVGRQWSAMAMVVLVVVAAVAGRIAAWLNDVHGRPAQCTEGEANGWS
jgi:hypothetical protein